jgi:DNA polymerase-3 subunit epsilon
MGAKEERAMNFTVLDFETANSRLSSICQIGLIEFRDGLVVDRYDRLINPREDFSNTWLHGIDAQDVRKSPTFTDIFETLTAKLTGKVVVCHTYFDRAALHRATMLYNQVAIDCRWLDTLRVARRAWPDYSSHGLRSLTAKFGIEFEHHHAAADAEATGLVLLRAIRESGINLDEWLVKSLVRVKTPPNAQELTANPDGALYGEQIAFTGEISKTRKEARTIAAQMGCLVDPETVSRITTILVSGKQDPRQLATGQDESDKMRKALLNIEQGLSTRIINETDFWDLCLIENAENITYAQ